MKLFATRIRSTFAPNATPTSDSSTVVLPTTSYAEKDGTWTTKDGRVQRITPILTKSFATRTEIQLMHDIAAVMGCEWTPMDAAALFSELAGATAAFAGLDYGKIGKQGKTIGAAEAAPA